jgi:hypothetical protein
VPDPVEALVAEWLATKNHTLFGRGYDLSQSVDAAASWFTAQMDDFLTYVESTPRDCPGCTGDPADHPIGLPKVSFDVV